MLDNEIIENIVNESVEVKTEVDSEVETPEVEATPEEEDSSEVEVEVEATETEPEVNEESDDTQEAESKEEEVYNNENFPPKAVNALSNVKKQAAKYRRQNEELSKQIETLKAQTTTEVEPAVAPKEEDFDTYSEFVSAETKFTVVNEMQNAQNAQVQEKLDSLQTEQKVAYTQEREHHMAEKFIQLSEKTPDYIDVLNENTAVIESLPTAISDIAYAIDDAPTAFYNLAKSGKLAQLASMPIDIARVEIIQAQYQQVVTPEKPVQKKKVSAAPAPINSARGTVNKSKSINKMDGDELYSFVTN